jgi:ribosomal protein L25 (general stress protein Ctc)
MVGLTDQYGSYEKTYKLKKKKEYVLTIIYEEKETKKSTNVVSNAFDENKKYRIEIPNIYETLFKLNIVDGQKTLLIKDYIFGETLTVVEEKCDYLIAKIKFHKIKIGNEFFKKELYNPESLFLIKIIDNNVADQYKNKWDGKCEFLYEAVNIHNDELEKNAISELENLMK